MTSGAAVSVKPDRIVDIQHKPAARGSALFEAQAREQIDLSLDDGGIGSEGRKLSGQRAPRGDHYSRAPARAGFAEHALLVIAQERQDPQIDAKQAKGREV